MSATEKLTTLFERMEQLRREISDIETVRPQSDNAALADLEGALLSELEQIQEKVRQIQSYIDRCSPDVPGVEPDEV